MLEKIIEASIKNKFLVIVGTLIAILWGIYAMINTPLDAIPDLSDVQVIIFTEYPGQSPKIVEDQVTYPLTTQMLSVPFSKVVRGYSFFGYSFVYVIFEDGTDLYWARSRVLEYLNYVTSRLPAGVTPTIGPDATGVGWVFEYVLQGEGYDLSQLRSIQDWYVRYELTSVPGVSEVASIGGFVKQYQVTLDPNKLMAYDIPLHEVQAAIQRSNNDVGGSVLEMAETEYMVRGLGYIKNLEDLRKVPVAVDTKGTPVLLRDIATVQLGPEMRRGVAEWNGEGEIVGGIVVMRSGENALKVIEDVKKKLVELKPGLPPGVTIDIAYDRSGLIQRSIDTLRSSLIEEIAVVALVLIVFLLHAWSALISLFTLPTAILISFIIMKWQGINANIMSLGGIAIAIGVMVDASIIMIDNAHKHLEHENLKPPHERKDHWQVILESSKEVGPSMFYSLLVITVSFIPIFTLEAQEGRLFKPLAFTKTYSMAAAAVLAITIVPVLLGYFIRGKILPESRNPINNFLMRLYHPALKFNLRHGVMILAAALALVAVTWFPFKKLGSEFMPPLYEGDLLYMPTTMPEISVTKSRELLQQTDRIIASFPEVHHVFGKIGRAETATDPAPMMMIETTIMLKPEDQWRPGMTHEKLIRELDAAIQFPGLTNAWTMPIKTRVDMLSTGIKTPVGIKIGGPDLNVLQEIGERVEAVVREIPGTLSVYSERVMGGNYFDFEIDRDKTARYGLTVGDVQDVIMSAIGGMNITTTVEGLERYPVNLRYGRELRDNPADLGRVLVPTPRGEHIPLAQLAEIKIHKGPPGIKSENARPQAWIYVDLRDIDVGTYVERAKRIVAEQVSVPPGYTIFWSGQYEYMERAQKRLMLIVPLTIIIIFLIIYLSTRSVIKCAIVFLAVPFSLVGAIWLLYLLGYNLSIAVWVGLIALAGLDAETGVVMLLYLDHAFEERRSKGLMRNLDDLREAIDYGAVKRVRPKIMTAGTTIIGLLPIMWSHGAGADVMKRIATPMVGGVVTSVIMELAVYPVIYYMWKSRGIGKTEAPGV
ncbi:MAG: cation transporter [Candidatus Glassbacteria bacterium RIFCSPLOWO2_12_FULL_58_11]|uniref:Cation transporter n=1 Tax=Candidatus Glassbacteria bacterium RIFCSPLOWO2_12_FULL_58_11 TaxID=1817867 RepID=A0A1F5YKI1_9BACT|nr:MAG: cation transporter [Candidatus Glassbacteria bacterium RIFCSPLOWO2_12_FULL_58_11]